MDLETYIIYWLKPLEHNDICLNIKQFRLD